MGGPGIVQHIFPPVHMTPHAPQFGLALSSVHVPPQQPIPAPHTVPHVPQLVRSVFVFTHAGGDPQHVVPAVQIIPQPPQFALVFTAMQVLPQQR